MAGGGLLGRLKSIFGAGGYREVAAEEPPPRFDLSALPPPRRPATSAVADPPAMVPAPAVVAELRRLDGTLDALDDAAPPAPALQLLGTTVAIDYEDDAGEVTRRPIRIIRVVERSARYIEAYCLLRKAPRTFRADRIIGAFDPETGEVVALAEWLQATTAAPPRIGKGGSDELIRRCGAGVSVLRFVAMADDEVHRSEQAVVDAYIATACDGRALRLPPLEVDPATARAWARTVRPTRGAFAVGLRRVVADGDAHVGLVLGMAVDLISADGVVHPAERMLAFELTAAAKGEALPQLLAGEDIATYGDDPDLPERLVRRWITLLGGRPRRLDDEGLERVVNCGDPRVMAPGAQLARAFVEETFHALSRR